MKSKTLQKQRLFMPHISIGTSRSNRILAWHFKYPVVMSWFYNKNSGARNHIFRHIAVFVMAKCIPQPYVNLHSIIFELFSHLAHVGAIKWDRRNLHRSRRYIIRQVKTEMLKKRFIPIINHQKQHSIFTPYIITTLNNDQCSYVWAWNFTCISHALTNNNFDLRIIHNS